MEKAHSKASKSPLKSKPLRHPGQSLDERIDTLLNDKLHTYVIFPAMLWAIAWIEWVAKVQKAPRMPGLYAICATALTIYMLFRILLLKKEIKNLKLGRDGERIVAEQLDILKQEGAFVFHDIPGDGFNLDHVVISPKGIFTIETKTISKPNSKAQIYFDGNKVFVQGREMSRNPVDQVSAQVAWLRGILKQSTSKDFYIHGAIVFPGWWVKSSQQARHSKLWVLEPKALLKWIRNAPDRLAGEEVSMANFHLRQYLELRARS